MSKITQVDWGVEGRGWSNRSSQRRNGTWGVEENLSNLKLVNTRRLSALTGLPAKRLRALAARKAVPCVRLGRQWAFSPERVQEWIEADGHLAKPAKRGKVATA